MRTVTSFVIAPLKFVLELTNPVTASVAANDKDATALTLVLISAVMAEPILEFTDVKVDAAVLVETFKDDTAVLSAVDSFTNAFDMVWLFVCSWTIAPETEVESEDRTEPRMLTSVLKELLRAESAATNEDVAELMVLEINEMD